MTLHYNITLKENSSGEYVDYSFSYECYGKLNEIIENLEWNDLNPDDFTIIDLRVYLDDEEFAEISIPSFLTDNYHYESENTFSVVNLEICPRKLINEMILIREYSRNPNAFSPYLANYWSYPLLNRNWDYCIFNFQKTTVYDICGLIYMEKNHNKTPIGTDMNYVEKKEYDKLWSHYYNSFSKGNSHSIKEYTKLEGDIKYFERDIRGFYYDTLMKYKIFRKYYGKAYLDSLLDKAVVEINNGGDINDLFSFLENRLGISEFVFNNLCIHSWLYELNIN